MKLLFGLVAAFCLSSCLIFTDSYYSGPYQYGTITVCDDFGCREAENVRYFVGSDGETYYYDVHFGIWLGSRGYWHGGAFHRGYYPGYHTYYHQGWYGGYHGGGGYRGGHSGHGGHR